MPYIWLDGMRLYSDHETEYEKRMREYKKEWQRANRKGKKYSIKKKDRVKKPVKMTEKIICECGGGYLYTTGKYNHEKSKKHINYYKEKQLLKEMNTITEVIEPIEIM